MKKELIQYLSKFATEHRVELFKKIINYRTNYITVVLEDIFQPHNASAVLRSCDCFGLQDVHIIENRNEYKVNPDVALGSYKWLNLNKFNSSDENTLGAIKKLKKDGYRIVATTPHTNDVDLEDFDLNKGKFALFFGTELTGLSETMLNNADEFLKIPMFGFTESFNISVSAAIILHHLTYKLRNSNINWQLTSEGKEDLILQWLKQSINKSDAIEKEFIKNYKSSNLSE
ncbi:MAG: TrmH family RNA methyltransferase [Bacteroidetes bacterium]|nr:MAG: TrmH family RNA methyltransferase [Bacteroidota bacterium]